MLNVIEKNCEQGSDELIVFLHGFGGCAAQWRGMQRHFSKTTDSVAVDLPGHAGSLGSQWKSPKAAAELVLQAVGNDRQKLHVVGHSMGGAVASLMALLAPNRVTRLTLLAPGGFGPEIAHDTLLRWAKAKAPAELGKIIPHFFAKDTEISPKIVELHSELRSKAGAVEALTSIGQGLARDGKQGELPLDALWQTPAQVYIIWGEEDEILPVSQARALQPIADQGRIDLHIVRNVGHSPAEEATELVRQVIDQATR